jgi:type III secretion system (T3SS) SseB-like protein
MRLRDKELGRSICCIERADDADSATGGPGIVQPEPAAGAPEPPFAESPLPAAMLAVAHSDTPQNRRILYESMFKTWFLVPTRDEPQEKPGFHDTQEDTVASFSLEHDSNGVVVAVAFTDEEALRNWNKDIPWIALQGTAFFQAVASTEAEEIVINPFEPENPKSHMIRPGGRVKRWELESLAQGVVPEPPSGSHDAGALSAQSVLIAMPKDMPSQEMFNALAVTAKTFAEVVEMYFAQVSYTDGDSRWTFAVEFASGTSRHRIESAMAALVKAARRTLPRKEPADFLLASTPLGQSVAATGKKIYGVTK